MFQRQHIANLYELSPNLLQQNVVSIVWQKIRPQTSSDQSFRWFGVWKASFLVVLGCFMISPAKADSVGGCRATPIKAYEFHAAAQMGQKVQNYLQRQDAQIAVIGRVGSDISKRGLKYTHAGILWRDHPRGRWGFVHELNTCGKDRSQIYDQGLLNFFLDDPFSYDTWVMIPKPWLQTAVHKALLSGVGAHLHWPHYSMISYPRSTQFQNSNEWLLEVFTYAEMVARQSGMPTRREVQRYHAQMGFRGSLVKIGGMEELFGRMFASNVGFSDHPRTSLRSGRYEFVSVHSIYRYFRQRGFLQASREFRGPLVMSKKQKRFTNRFVGNHGR